MISQQEPGIWNRIQGFLYSYDGAETSKRRKSPAQRIKSPDDGLTVSKRRQLQANTRDLQKNFSVAAWAIRRHLDYVSAVNFEANSGDDVFDRELEDFYAEWSRAGNCDVAGRHNLQRMVRLAEARRTVDGDVFFVLMSSGHVQAIESDRVRNPYNIETKEADQWRHGVRTSIGGRLREIAVHKRLVDGSYEHERNIVARNVIQLGYYDEFDQRRGVSPMASAVNAFKDLSENFDFALAKAKLSQLFAVAMYLSDDSPLKDDDDGGEVGLGNQVRMFDGGPDDKIEVLESKNPSSEFQAFQQLVTESALKSLDIPFSFHSENYSTFYGSRASHLEYIKACKSKREDIAEFLERLFRWRISVALRNRELRLPRSVALRDVQLEWIPAGVPWWRPLEETKADQLAVEAKFKTRSQICRERLGKSFREVVDRLAEEEEYMRSKGLTVTVTDPSQQQPQQQADPEEPEDDDDDDQDEVVEDQDDQENGDDDD